MLSTPPSSTLELFKTELWKDQRQLEIGTLDGRDILKKYFRTEEEHQRELSVVSYLSGFLNVAKVPQVLQTGSDYVVYPYIQGTRVFNLLVELDRLAPSLAARAAELKSAILDRCVASQSEIQGALQAMPEDPTKLRPYPVVTKLRSIMQLLTDVLELVVDWDSIDKELGHLALRWNGMACVPFRDSTTKNMVLAEPCLWLGHFDGEDARRSYISQSVEREGSKAWSTCPIIDFDFASCNELTTMEDDPISLLFHERTWRGLPKDAASVNWLGMPDRERAALTFFVRYYRFGGRKAAYRLLHPAGHRVRFRHDKDTFYFHRLPSIVVSLWPNFEDEYGGLLALTRSIGRSLGGGRPEVDHFLASGLAESRQYFVDMFPE